jgi:betaine lipid synthase
MFLVDWFPNTLSGAKSSSSSSSSSRCELTETVRAVHRTLKKGGRAFWRSAAMDPWYAELFRQEGFAVERLGLRVPGSKVPIDRVNMSVFFFFACPSFLSFI